MILAMSSPFFKTQLFSEHWTLRKDYTCSRVIERQTVVKYLKPEDDMSPNKIVINEKISVKEEIVGTVEEVIIGKRKR